MRQNIVSITRAHWEKMHIEVDRHSPEEACGLLAGIGNEVFEVIPVQNKLHSPVRYLMAPEEQLNAFLRMEEKNLDLVGIYHSHPNGPDRPSPTDINEAYYPEAIHFIWFKTDREWRCKAYRIHSRVVTEVELIIA